MMVPAMPIAIRERGEIGGLAELATVGAIAALLIIGSVIIADPFSSAGSDGVRQTEAVFEAANKLAATDGATLAFTPAGTSAVIQLYAHRPNGALGTPVMSQQVPEVQISSGGSTTFGIFIDKNGTVSEQSGFTAGTTIASPPPCATSIALTFTHGTLVQAHSVSCFEGRVQ